MPYAQQEGGAGAPRRELLLDALEVREEAPSGTDELRRTEIAQEGNGLSGCAGEARHGRAPSVARVGTRPCLRPEPGPREDAGRVAVAYGGHRHWPFR
ncbi:hypothetical protein GCM10018780_02900 [Streptomyces lanatus]|nr:hypothetical protein GCM10018780_02900 [Streptomyces lanatus]